MAESRLLKEDKMRIAGKMFDIQRARMIIMTAVTLLLLLAGLTSGAIALPTSTLTVTVNCGTGQSVGDALKRGAEGQPLGVVVQGTCNENVSVSRDDVKLQGDPNVGGGVNGPDAATNTIDVTGRRVTIDSLLVAGGLNGIGVSASGGLTVRNSTVQNTSRTGIVFVQGASGTVDGCTIQNNARDGVAIDSSASAFVINSVITQNRRGGVVISDGGSARIGLNAALAPAGNTISLNGGSGVSISLGSAAFIAANTISGNGTDPASAIGRSGIIVTNATVQLIGLNSITDNAAAGIFTTSAVVRVGNPSFGFSTANTISQNGASAPANGGISASLGSSLQIQNATITQNVGPGIFAFVGSTLQLSASTISGNTGSTNGFGVVLSLNSSAQMFANSIQGNQLDGIRLAFASKLFLQTPVSTVSGNGGFGLQCTDGESSVVNTLFLSLSGNGLGGVSGTCTGF